MPSHGTRECCDCCGCYKTTEEKKVNEEKVDHPAHYQSGKPEYETIVILENTLTRNEFIGFLKGNVFKYNDRANKKGNPTEDYRKAHWYQTYLTDFLTRTDEEDSSK